MSGDGTVPRVPPVPILLALVSSALYGSGDFFGGVASRRAAAFAVTWWSQLASLVPLGMALALWGPVTVGRADLGWGGLGGVCGGVALMTFYGALSVGPMSIVAPVTGVVGASVPALAGLAAGDRIPVVTAIGLVGAVVSIGLVSASSHGDQAPVIRSTVLKAVAAGLGFGAFFVCFGKASTAAGMWPLLGARVGSITILSTLAVLRRADLRLAPPAVRPTMVAGVFDVTANGTLLWAITRGPVSTIGVLSSLYPAATVLLARMVLRERLARVQIAGIGAAAAAVVLISSGHPG